MLFGNEILQIPRFIYEDILTKMHIYVYVMMEKFDNPRKYKKDSGSSYRGGMFRLQGFFELKI